MPPLFAKDLRGVEISGFERPPLPTAARRTQRGPGADRRKAAAAPKRSTDTGTTTLMPYETALYRILTRTAAVRLVPAVAAIWAAVVTGTPAPWTLADVGAGPPSGVAWARSHPPDLQILAFGSLQGEIDECG